MFCRPPGDANVVLKLVLESRDSSEASVPECATSCSAVPLARPAAFHHDLQQFMLESSKPSEQDVNQWLVEHGDLLYCFALKRVGDQNLAEDLVQDTFLAALRAVDRFEGRAKVQTWLVGILKNKIVDHFRKTQRSKEVASNDDPEFTPFTKHGHWSQTVKSWGDPARALENEEFLGAFTACRGKLPRTLADAFRLRELEDLPMAEICETLGISATNLSVRLHRARVILRECLERNWFMAGGTTP